MSPAPRISRPTSRFPRYAAAAGSLALAGALAVSGLVGGGAVEDTEAAWIDTEHARAAITANWMQGFTRVTNPGWSLQRVSSDDASYFSYGLEGPEKIDRDFGLTYPQISGYSLAEGRDWSARSLGGQSPDPAIVPNRRTSDDLWMGEYVTPGILKNDITYASFCMSYPQPTQIAGTTPTCFADPNRPPRLIAHQNTIGYTFSIESFSSKIARINVSGFSSTAQCFTDGSSSASIRDQDAILELANETTAGNGGYNNTESITEYIPDSDSAEKRFDGTTDKWARYNVNGENSARYVILANIRKNTFTSDYYALAEMDLVAQVYSAGGASLSPGRYIGQINLPLTRSECGFSDGNETIPPMAGLWRGDPNQLPWPDPWIRTPQTVPDNSAGRLQDVRHPATPSFFTPDAVLPDQKAPDKQARESLEDGLRPAATVMSPTEHSTTTNTTTSEPPHSDNENEEVRESDNTHSTTTTAATTTAARAAAATPTSTRPSFVIPTKPTALPASAPTAGVDTVEVNGDDLDVVVRGATAPADARTGARVLGNWINDDPVSTNNWKTFASDAPDEDGWRWAAINQKTGTVVYIR